MTTYRTADGGTTWEPTAVLGPISFPELVMQPDGGLVVIGGDIPGQRLTATRSADQATSFSTPATITSVHTPGADGTDVGLNGSSWSAAADTAGRLLVAWTDCQLRPTCDRNDILLSSSTDANTWSPPRATPRTTAEQGEHRQYVRLAIEPGTTGPHTHLALTYQALSAVTCTDTCTATATALTSTDDAATVRRWNLTDPTPASWLPPRQSEDRIGPSGITTRPAAAVPAYLLIAPNTPSTFDVRIAVPATPLPF